MKQFIETFKLKLSTGKTFHRTGEQIFVSISRTNTCFLIYIYTHM